MDDDRRERVGGSNGERGRERKKLGITEGLGDMVDDD